LSLDQSPELIPNAIVEVGALRFGLGQNPSRLLEGSFPQADRSFQVLL
jgi:hypothetical protein